MEQIIADFLGITVSAVVTMMQGRNANEQMQLLLDFTQQQTTQRQEAQQGIFGEQDDLHQTTEADLQQFITDQDARIGEAQTSVNVDLGSELSSLESDNAAQLADAQTTAGNLVTDTEALGVQELADAQAQGETEISMADALGQRELELLEGAGAQEEMDILGAGRRLATDNMSALMNAGLGSSTMVAGAQGSAFRNTQQSLGRLNERIRQERLAATTLAGERNIGAFSGAGDRNRDLLQFTGQRDIQAGVDAGDYLFNVQQGINESEGTQRRRATDINDLYAQQGLTNFGLGQDALLELAGERSDTLGRRAEITLGQPGGTVGTGGTGGTSEVAAGLSADGTQSIGLPPSVGPPPGVDSQSDGFFGLGGGWQPGDIFQNFIGGLGGGTGTPQTIGLPPSAGNTSAQFGGFGSLNQLPIDDTLYS